MKINSGFISNSSTSSFICFGWREEEKNLMKLFYKYLDFKKIKYKKKNIEFYEDFYLFLDDITVYSDDLQDVTCNLNGDIVTVGEEICTDDIDELKNQISLFEEKCLDENHIYSYFMKTLGKPNFLVDIIVNY